MNQRGACLATLTMSSVAMILSIYGAIRPLSIADDAKLAARSVVLGGRQAEAAPLNQLLMTQRAVALTRLAKKGDRQVSLLSPAGIDIESVEWEGSRRFRLELSASELRLTRGVGKDGERIVRVWVSPNMEGVETLWVELASEIVFSAPLAGR